MVGVEAKRKASGIIRELETTINNYSSISAGFSRIIELGRALRDAAFSARGLEEEEREEAFELLRHAKLIALAQSDAEKRIWRLQMVEDDLRRVA